MRAKFTPGPWKIKWYDGSASIIAEDGHGRLARVFARWPYTQNQEEYAANARLIAACPTMREYISRKAKEGDGEAIAKVRGEL